MKREKIFPFIVTAFVLFGFQQCTAQKPENWTQDQLIEPATLAKTITSNENVPLIYCVGPGVVIPNSINIGPANDENNLQKFKDSLSNVPRSADIVIYCGCCPFAHCPNVRPAITVLKEMNFTNYHLLDLPHNIKADWIAKGYPDLNK